MSMRYGDREGAAISDIWEVECSAGGDAGGDMVVEISEPGWSGGMRTIKAGGLAALALGVMVVGASAQAQFPGGKAIEMTVMFGAGSAADVTARYLADGMAKRLNVPVPVVNR